MEEACALLHIGAEGNGSEEIQRFISVNEAALTASGIRVPGCFKGRNHFELAIPAWEPGPADKLLGWRGIDQHEVPEFARLLGAQLAADAESGGSRLFSSEFLSSTAESPQQVSQVRAVLDGAFDAYRILMFVRRPEHLIAVRYAAAVLAGRTTQLSPAERSGRIPGVDLMRTIRSWQQVFSDAEFTLRAYPESGGARQVVRIFIEWLGLDPDAPEWVWPPSDLEWTPGPSGVEAVRRLNAGGAALTPDDRRVVVTTVRSLPPEGEVLALPSADVEQARLHWADYNAAVAEQLPASDRDLYLAEGSLVSQAGRVDEAIVEKVLARVDGALRRSRAFRLLPAGAQAPAALQLRPLAARAEAELRDRGQSAAFLEMTSELREGIGAFAVESAQDGGAIPASVVQYWEPWPPPAQVAQFMLTWDEIGAPEQHSVVDRRQAEALVADLAGDQGVAAMERCWHPAMRADIFRYAYLYRHGGWYVDAEHEARLPHAPVLQEMRGHVLLRREERHVVTNSFIGAHAGSSIMRRCFDQSVANVLAGEDDRIWHITGPGVLSRIVGEAIERGSRDITLLPAGAIFGVLQRVRSDADYRKSEHWSLLPTSSGLSPAPE